MDMLSKLPQRIAVVGTSGSGKTTLARRLSELLDIPHVEFDALYWGPNWTTPDKEVFRERVSQALRAERWVTCGNYNSIKEITFTRADTLAWLDYPFALVLTRLIHRTAQRLNRDESLWGTNRESLRKVLSWDSIVVWAFQSHWKNRRRYLALTNDPEYAHLTILRLNSPKQTERFMHALASRANPRENPVGSHTGA